MYLNVRFGYTFLTGRRTDTGAWSTKGECMMKKIRSVMAALLIAVLAVSLTACGSRDSKQPTASSGTPGTSAPYSAGSEDETGQSGTVSSSEEMDSTSRSETDTTREGVMDGIADDVREGMEDIKEDVTDMTESDLSDRSQNR